MLIQMRMLNLYSLNLWTGLWNKYSARNALVPSTVVAVIVSDRRQAENSLKSNHVMTHVNHHYLRYHHIKLTFSAAISYAIQLALIN